MRVTIEPLERKEKKKMRMNPNKLTDTSESMEMKSTNVDDKRDFEGWIMPHKNPQNQGHPWFHEVLNDIRDLHNRKNSDYAGGGNPLGNFYRVGKILSLYPDLKCSDPRVVNMIYRLKQIDAVLWLLNTHREGQVESIADREQDVCCYSAINMVIDRELREGYDHDKRNPCTKVGGHDKTTCVCSP